MGRPSHRRKPTKEEAAFLTMIAMGICGWALAIETLILFERKKILTDKQSKRIITGATRGLQAMEELQPHPALFVAISLMQGQLDGWDDATRQAD